MAATLSNSIAVDTPLRNNDHKIRRLATASAKRVIDPDVDIPGGPGAGAVLPPELLSVAGIDLGLTDEQLALLSREEVASIADTGVRFECILIAGLALSVSSCTDLRDPRVLYSLHEMGEETRHSRLFLRLIEGLGPTAKNPLNHPLYRAVERIVSQLLPAVPALLHVLALTGEEIPDLIQRRAFDHPDTDDFVREVNRYHRLEEARHLAFARARFAELWAEASWLDKFLVRHVAPQVMSGMFDMQVHPGAYAAVGLPGWRTWATVRRHPARRTTRHESLRPVIGAVLDGGAFIGGRVPGGWQRLCGVDRKGRPRA